jgi:hypothetical protein
VPRSFLPRSDVIRADRRVAGCSARLSRVIRLSRWACRAAEGHDSAIDEGVSQRLVQPMIFPYVGPGSPGACASVVGAAGRCAGTPRTPQLPCAPPLVWRRCSQASSKRAQRQDDRPQRVLPATLAKIRSFPWLALTYAYCDDGMNGEPQRLFTP